MDLFIVAQPTDFPWLLLTLPSTLEHVQPATVYIATYAVDDAEMLFPDAVVVSLTRYPFTLEQVATYLHSAEHAYTYLVQLARLYASSVLTMNQHVLWLDADTAVVAPLPPGTVLCRHGTHLPFFLHMSQLHPSLRKRIHQSADVPLLSVDTHVVRAALHAVEEVHTTPFWRTYLSSVHPLHLRRGASEKEFYVSWWAQTNAVQTELLRCADVRSYERALPAPPNIHCVRCPYAPKGSCRAVFSRTVPWTLWTQPVATQALPLPRVWWDELLAPYAGMDATVVDIGCGHAPDLTLWQGWTYHGLDCNADVIAYNQQRYQGHVFTCLDACVDSLPKGTIALCLNVLPHLCFAHALALLRRTAIYGKVIVADYQPVARGVLCTNVDRPTGSEPLASGLWLDVPPFDTLPTRELLCVPVGADRVLRVMVLDWGLGTQSMEL